MSASATLGMQSALIDLNNRYNGDMAGYQSIDPSDNNDEQQTPNRAVNHLERNLKLALSTSFFLSFLLLVERVLWSECLVWRRGKNRDGCYSICVAQNKRINNYNVFTFPKCGGAWRIRASLQRG